MTSYSQITHHLQVSSTKDVPGISDHTAIAIADTICHPVRNRPIPRVIHLWNRANVPLLKEILKTQILTFCEKHSNTGNSNTNELWLDLKTIVNNTMKNIPTKRTSVRFHQPWINQKCKGLSSPKKKLYRRAKQTRLSSDWDKFKGMTSKCKKHVDKLMTNSSVKTLSILETLNVFIAT